MVPVVLIRRNRIVDKLKKAGAFTPQTAVDLEKARVAKSDRSYPGLLKMMLREKDIQETEDGKYYLTVKHR